MKRYLILFMVLCLVISVGCGKKEQPKKADAKQGVNRAEKMSLVDPVDGKLVDKGNVQWFYVYGDTEYNFNSKENMDAFIADPEKYLKKDNPEQ
ncbi:MAG: YHS domain-containing protein [Candidatus Krumholzibacteriota bacterium]|nr:YHS domain-containing protein [Candidatus Krumholzibacteriota bacterium]